LPVAQRRDTHTRVAFSWATFFWRSKRKQIGRRAETRLATKENPSNKEVQLGRRAETQPAMKEKQSLNTANINNHCKWL
jgi:hypothetical protein